MGGHQARSASLKEQARHGSSLELDQLQRMLGSFQQSCFTGNFQMEVKWCDIPRATPLHSRAIDQLRVSVSHVLIILGQCVRKRESMYYHTGYTCLFQLLSGNTTGHGSAQAQKVLTIEKLNEHLAGRLRQPQKEVTFNIGHVSRAMR